MESSVRGARGGRLRDQPRRGLALARKEREGLFTADEHDAAVGQLRQDFREVYLPRPVTGDPTREHALRAYDVVYMATALILREEARELAKSSREAEEPAPQRGDEQPQVAMMTFDAPLVAAAGDECLAHPELPSREEPWPPLVFYLVV